MSAAPPSYEQSTQQAHPPSAPPPDIGFQYGQYGQGDSATPIDSTPYPDNAPKNDERNDVENLNTETETWAGSSFSNKKIRQAFIKKVYLILMVQLAVTVGIICLFIFVNPIKYWVQNNGWFYWCSYGVFLVTYIALVCCPAVRRKFPGNFICLGIFTLAFSYMAGTISSYYSTSIVLIAIGITAAVCLAISLFAIQTRIDFTMCAGLIFALAMVLFFFGWACLIVYLVAGSSYILNAVYGALAALVFSLFLVFDTQMLVGGRKFELSPEEYIFGSLQLYLDVVYLFLIIVSCAGSSSN